MTMTVVRRRTRTNMGIFAMWFIGGFLVVRAQELGHFDKDSTMDFEKLGVLAEIMATTSTRSSGPRSTTTPDNAQGWTTTSLWSKSTSGTARTTSTKDVGGKLTTTILVKTTTEDGGRLGRVVGLEVTSESIADLVEETEKVGPTTDMEKESDKINVSNPLGDITAATSSADFTPPHITWPIAQDKTIVRQDEKNNFVFYCKADGIPTPTFEWLKDDIQVEYTPGHIQAFKNGTLYIQTFTHRENGIYQCRAINKYGTSVSVKFPILLDEDPEYIKIETVQLDAKVGDAVALKCENTPPTVSKYIRRWYFGSDSTEVKTDERIGTDSEGTLRFAYVLKEDEKAYRCGLAGAESQDVIRFYKAVDLRISENELTETDPKKEFASEHAKANLGSENELECFFAGYPVPNMMWLNNSNQPITSGNPRYEVTDKGRKLRIISVEQRDEGNFSCIAENSRGRQQQSLRLNVTTPPLRRPLQEGHTSLYTLTRPDQHDVTLMCKAMVADGERYDMPMWFRNGDLLNELNLPDSTRYKFNSDHTELYISDLNKKVDTACFQCNITNSEGHIFYDGYLRVIESIKIVKRPAESIEISYADTVDISVVATGDGCCERDVQWEFEGEPLTRGDLQKPPFVWRDNGNIIFFNASSVSNDTLKSKVGHYMVRVSNVADAVEVSFTISLKGTDPGPQVAGDSNIKLWWIGLICGLLAIVIAIVIIIFFIKSNYPRDTYQLEKTELKHNLNPEEDLLNQSFQDI